MQFRATYIICKHKTSTKNENTSTIPSPPSSCDWQTIFLVILCSFPSHRNWNNNTLSSRRKSSLGSVRLTKRYITISFDNTRVLITVVTFPWGVIWCLLYAFKILLISVSFPSKLTKVICVMSVENLITRTLKIPESQQKFIFLKSHTWECFLLPVHTVSSGSFQYLFSIQKWEQIFLESVYFH